MEKSILNAFIYMFKDNDWVYKLFILLCLVTPVAIIAFFQVVMLSNGKISEGSNILFLVALTLISIFFSLISSGYYAKCANNIIYSSENSSNNDLLPKWEDDFGQFFKLGFRFFLATLLLGVSILGSLFILGVVADLLKGLSLLIYIVGGIAAVIFILVYSYFSTALASIFYSNYDITSFFKFKEARKLVSYDSSKYLQIMGIMFLISLLMSIISSLFAKNLLLVLIMPIAQVYTMLVSAYLAALIFPAEPEVFLSTD